MKKQNELNSYFAKINGILTDTANQNTPVVIFVGEGLDAAVASLVLKSGMSGVFQKEERIVFCSESQNFLELESPYVSIGIGAKGETDFDLDAYRNLLESESGGFNLSMSAYKLLQGLKNNTGAQNIKLPSLELSVLSSVGLRSPSDKEKDNAQNVLNHLVEKESRLGACEEDIMRRLYRKKELVEASISFISKDAGLNVSYDYLIHDDRDSMLVLQRVSEQVRAFIKEEISSLRDTLKVHTAEERIPLLSADFYEGEMARIIAEKINSRTSLPVGVIHKEEDNVRISFTGESADAVVKEFQGHSYIKILSSSDIGMKNEWLKSAINDISKVDISELMEVEESAGIVKKKAVEIEELKHEVAGNSVGQFEGYTLKNFLVQNSKKLRNGNFMGELVSADTNTNKITFIANSLTMPLDEMKSAKRIVIQGFLTNKDGEIIYSVRNAMSDRDIGKDSTIDIHGAKGQVVKNEYGKNQIIGLSV